MRTAGTIYRVLLCGSRLTRSPEFDLPISLLGKYDYNSLFTDEETEAHEMK